MPEENRCPQCGRVLSADTLQGLCPACLLKRGLETNTLDETADEHPNKKPHWTPPSVEELAGTFPELEILEFIGRGGMGAVYKVRQKELNRTAALKILPPEIGKDESLSKNFAQRFTREAQAMARLNHPNIVTIYDFGQRGNTGDPPVNMEDKEKKITGETPVPLYFFLMEYVDGLSLRQVLDAGGVEPAEALAIVPQICDALQYAHDNGIVHRDIKPENILMNRDGKVKIADFGLAKLVGGAHREPPPSGGGINEESSEDTPGSHRGLPQDESPDVNVTIGQHVMGTPQYMAPEQIDRPADVDHRADIYSLGVVFYQMLTGELPKGKFQPPSRKVLIDVRLDEVVLRALEKDPSRRYQQVSEVKTQVETIVATSGQASPSLTSILPLTPEAKQQLDDAREAVRAPAIGLLVAAGINLAVLFAGIGITLINVTAAQRFIKVWLFVLPPLFVGLVLNFLILCNALYMMRLCRRGLAITGAILAMVAAPGNILGLPFGIWSLVVLSRRNVVEAFAAAKRNQSTPSILSSVVKTILSILLILLLVGLAMLAGYRGFYTPKSKINPISPRSLQSPQTQPCDAETDVRQTARAFLTAIHKKDINTLKSLSLGSVLGWKDNIQKNMGRKLVFRGLNEQWICGKFVPLFRKFAAAGDPAFLNSIKAIAVKGGWAAAGTNIKEKRRNLYFIFRKTRAGWKFAAAETTRDLMADESLKKIFATKIPQLEQTLKELLTADGVTATQPAASTSAAK